MHAANMKFWEHAKEKYPKYFTNPSKVIEVGSYNINGTVRILFTCDDYIGIDWLAGPGVDVVSLAHDINFDYKFDTVISASMLEHDPYWEKSLDKMISLMKDDGILLLSWGGALSGAHCLGFAPDGGYHPLKAEKGLNFLKNAKIFINEFRYENIFMGGTGWCGEVALIGFKDEKYSLLPHILDPLAPQDMEKA
jgi:SAM-dependent methyltransferase